ncbi:MAG: bifunctional riboflavin kinase/FAD synthetase [Dehalococcoidia bacterium]
MFAHEVDTVIDDFLQVSLPGDAAVTIGVFDGVHLGHQDLILRAKDEASKRELLSTVVTFRNHPRTVLTPGFKPQYLTGLEERLELIRALGVDLVVPITFTKAVSQLRAREFVSLLKDRLRMKALVVGPDFALGKGREGDLPTLARLGKEMGYSVIRVAFTDLEGQTVSSTSIREALSIGDVARIASLQGRPFRLTGRVVVGEKRGHLLGFPTANLEIDQERALPADGLYATRAYLGVIPYHAVTYIGARPTFAGSTHAVEVYILDFQDDIYGQELTIDLIDRLREDIAFSRSEELIAQMNEDVARAREVLTRA